MPATRQLMRLRTAMVDEPDPGPPTVVAPVAPKKRKWLKHETADVPGPEMTEAMYGYVAQEKVSHKKAWGLCAVLTIVLLCVQWFARRDMGLLSAVATAYVYAIPVMALWLLWSALSDSMQRLAVFILMPVAWMAVDNMLKEVPVMVYFILFTVIAYVVYLVDYLIRECTSEAFRIAGTSFLVTAVTQQLFLLGNPDFMARSATFPLVVMVLNPFIKAGHLIAGLMPK